MKKCLHIASTVPATITLATGDSFYIGDKKVHILADDNLFATYTPMDNNYLPYSFNLPAGNGPNIHVVPYCNNHVDILLSPMRARSWQALREGYDQTFGRVRVTENSDESCSYITIQLDGDTKFSTVCDKLSNIECQTNSYIMILGDCDNGKYVIVLDDNFAPIVNGKCDIVENESDTLKVLINSCDIAKHGKVYEFNKSNYTCDSYLVYLVNSPNRPTNTQLIPMAFLQAIKCNNLSLAKSYMSNGDISDEQLTNYFGTISDVYYNVYDTNNINYTVVGDVIKSYNFILNGDKIADIEEVPLSF